MGRRTRDPDVRYSQAFSAGLLAFGESDTRRRVKNIMKFTTRKKWVGIVAAVVIIITGISCLTNAVNNTETRSNKIADTSAVKKSKSVSDNKHVIKVGTITLQITNSEGKADTKEVHNIEDWEKYSDWNKFILIPVLVTTDSSSSNNYYGSSSNVISIQHDLKPGYARLKGGTNATNTSLDKEQQDKYKLKLEVVSTNFGTKSK